MRSVFVHDIIEHPLNKVILERSFDQLVEKVGGKYLVNFCSGKCLGERLLEISLMMRPCTD